MWFDEPGEDRERVGEIRRQIEGSRHETDLRVETAPVLVRSFEADQ
jgi:hypothetical protein